MLKFGSVAEKRADVAACFDGSLPLEPYQLVSQNKVEPLLREIAEQTPNVTVRYGQGLTDFEQDNDQVCVTVAVHEPAESIRPQMRYQAAYLVGCDGGVSTVRSGWASNSRVEGEFANCGR